MSFYLIALLLVICSFFVISVRNPIYAILALMLSFGVSFVLFLSLGAEFVAILILMYILVLFRFYFYLLL
jgi:NADH-quinone oxidoreductase subunit J